MQRRSVPGLVLLALAFAATAAPAAEPDGRVAFRYAWLGEREADKEPRRLRLSVTALVPLEEIRLEAASPSGVATFVPAWPAQGFALGGLGAGAARSFELEVAEPAEGGEILTFTLRALDAGVPVTETVGIPVGTPGMAPTLRHGAAEFPAVRDGTRP